MKLRMRLMPLAAVCVMVCGATLSACNAPTEEYMGNTGEVTLEDGDLFATISILDYGDIVIKLFPEAAPKAVQQFIRLSQRGFYDGSTFHRVIEDYLVQGGSLTGSGFDGDVVSSEYFDIETNDRIRNYYGAVAFAKNSKGNYCQFYIVNNNNPVDIDEIAATLRADLDNPEKTDAMLESDIKYYEEIYAELAAYPEAVKEKYRDVGGNYQLDGEYTVFAQVIDGFDVLESISAVETVSGNVSDDEDKVASKPLVDIVIEKIEVVHIVTEETTTTAKTRATRESTADISTTPTDVVVPINPEVTSEEVTVAPETDAEQPVETITEQETETE